MGLDDGRAVAPGVLRPPSGPLTGSPSGDLAPGHGPRRNTLFSLVSQIISATFTIGLTLFLVRELGPATYGVLALAVSVSGIVMLTSDLGISRSAARFTAESPQDRLHAAAVLRVALGLKFIASTIAAVALALLAPVIADAYGIPALTLPLRLIAIAGAAQGIGALFLSWFEALGRLSLGIRYALTESSIETTASVCLVLLGGGAAGAVGGRAIGFTAAAILAALLAARVVGWRALKSARGGVPARKIAGYGAPLVLVDAVFAIFDRADVLIIGAYLGSASAGIFDAATRILAFAGYPSLAVSAGFAPRLAHGQRSRDDSALFLGALRYTILLYLLLAAPLFVWAEPIVDLTLGEGYSEAADVLRVMAPFLAVKGMGPMLAGAANYLGEARRRVPVAAGALLVNVAIDIVLVPRIGIVAGAIGTGVAFTIYVVGHMRICQPALEISFASLVPTAARGALAAGVAGVVLFAIGTSELSPLAWIAGPLVAAFAYISTLFLVRELHMDEVRAALRLIRPLLPRAAAQ
jgi:O-antigen/teichoic acid export membrane protein